MSEYYVQDGIAMRSGVKLDAEYLVNQLTYLESDLERLKLQVEKYKVGLNRLASCEGFLESRNTTAEDRARIDFAQWVLNGR